MATPTQHAALIGAVRTVAAAEILPRFRNLDAAEIGEKSSVDDLVTVADRAAEVALSAAASRVLPGAAIVGEEMVSEDPSHLEKITGADACVIIDPIDGTANFVAGLPTFGVILALVENGQTTFGLLYDPVSDDWVAAAAGQGAWYGKPGAPDRPLRARKVTASQAVGFLSPRLYDNDKRGALFDAYQGFHLVRSLGCSCHDYRTIAFGRADFVSSPMMNPWDHAAGVLVLHELGGETRVAGSAAYAPHLTQGPIAGAGTPAILPEIIAAQNAEPRSRLAG
ncbi:MAG: inositol monophosphatase [Pseudomonadota bacterium]